MTRGPTFTDAQDKALLVALAAAPSQRLLAMVVYLLIRDLPNRAAIVQRLIGL